MTVASSPPPRWGVLLVAFGGPRALEEVPAFLARVLARRPPDHVVAEVTARYRLLGGRSPLPQVTEEQAERLAQALGVPVAAGMAYSDPSVAEAAARLARQGVREAVVLALAPYRSRVSRTRYEELGVRALQAAGVAARLPGDWHLHPEYLAALADRLTEALAALPPEERSAPVVFTAHSLPRAYIDQGDPYADQLAATAERLARIAGVARWTLAFQSQSLTAREPWLGPEATEVFAQLVGEGARGVVVDPIGFLADHLETLYDSDVEQRRRAEELGLRFTRVPCLNLHPRLIAALADIARQAVAAA